MSIRTRLAILVGTLLAITVPLLVYLVATYVGTRQSLREARSALGEFTHAVETGISVARARVKYLDAVATGGATRRKDFAQAVDVLEANFQSWLRSSQKSLDLGIAAEADDFARIQELRDGFLEQARQAKVTLERRLAPADAGGMGLISPAWIDAAGHTGDNIETLTEEELLELGSALDNVLLRMGSTPWIARSGPRQLEIARATLLEVRAVARVRGRIVDQAEHLAAHLIAQTPESELALLRTMAHVEDAESRWSIATLHYAAVSGEAPPPHAANFTALHPLYQAEVSAIIALAERGQLDEARTRATAATEMTLEGTLLPITEEGLTAELAEINESLDRLHQLTSAAGATGIAFFLAVTLTSMLLFLATVRHLVRSLDQLRRAVDMLGAGNLEYRINMADQDEFGQLGRAFDRMAGQLLDQVEQRNALEQKLLRNAQMATLGQVIATVSHELRNPLGTIGTAVHSLRKHLQGTDIDVERVLSRTERSVARCDAIIEELLDYIRTKDAEPEPTALDSWTDAVLDDMVVPSAISVARNFHSGATVPIDRNRIQGCLANVVANACQAMLERRDGIGQHTLRVETRLSDGRVEWVLTDNGPGIEPELLEQVFEPMFSTRPFGVGLGLSIVSKYMEQHAGGVEITSTPGQGTQVVLWLPASAHSPSRESAAPNA